MKDYIQPEFNSDGFNCPHCLAFTQQEWYEVAKVSIPKVKGVVESSSATYRQYHNGIVTNYFLCFCTRCKNYSLWINDKMVYPNSSIVPLPIEDMPKDVTKEYLEARNIINGSPKAAAALLRLALEKLVTDHLDTEGDDLNSRIGYLVKNGLPKRIQKALDSVRVIGNESVHPGEIDLDDDSETAVALFELLNIIIEYTITQDKKIDQIYGKLPTRKIQGIENRDKAK